MHAMQDTKRAAPGHPKASLLRHPGPLHLLGHPLCAELQQLYADGMRMPPKRRAAKRKREPGMGDRDGSSSSSSSGKAADPGSPTGSMGQGSPSSSSSGPGGSGNPADGSAGRGSPSSSSRGPGGLGSPADGSASRGSPSSSSSGRGGSGNPADGSRGQVNPSGSSSRPGGPGSSKDYSSSSSSGSPSPRRSNGSWDQGAVCSSRSRSPGLSSMEACSYGGDDGGGCDDDWEADGEGSLFGMVKGMSRISAAKAFYSMLVQANMGSVAPQQEVPYGDITLSHVVHCADEETGGM